MDMNINFIKTTWQHGIWYNNSRVPPRACDLPSAGLLIRIVIQDMKSLLCYKSHNGNWFLWLARESILLYCYTFCMDKWVEHSCEKLWLLCSRSVSVIKNNEVLLGKKKKKNFLKPNEISQLLIPRETGPGKGVLYHILAASQRNL